MELVTLVCPPGAADAPISHGDCSFRPYLQDPHDHTNTTWLVEVPAHVAMHLCAKGGFWRLDGR